MSHTPTPLNYASDPLLPNEILQELRLIYREWLEHESCDSAVMGSDLVAKHTEDLRFADSLFVRLIKAADAFEEYLRVIKTVLGATKKDAYGYDTKAIVPGVAAHTLRTRRRLFVARSLTFPPPDIYTEDNLDKAIKLMPAACSVFRPCDFFDGLSEIRPGHHGWAFVFRRELEQELFGRERFQLIHVDEQNKKKFFGVYTAMRWSEGDMNGPEFLTLKPKVREAIIMHLSIGRASDVAPMLAASQTTVSCVILRCVMGVELPLEKAGLLASVGFKDFLEETRVRRFQEYDENRFRYIQDKPNSFSRGTVFSAPVAPIPPKLDPSNALPHDPYMQGPGSRAGAPRRGTPHQTPPSQHMTIAQSNTPQGLGTLPQAATDSSGRRLSIPQAASHDPVPPPRHSYNPTPSASEASQSDGPSSCHGGSQHGSDHVPAIPRSPLHFGHGHPGNAYGQGPNMQEPQIAPPNHVNRPVFQSNGYPRAQHHGSQPSWNPPPPSYFGRQLQNTAYPGMVRSNQHVQPQTSGMVRHVGATNTNVYSTLAHSNGSNATPQRYPPPYAAPPIVHGRALKDNPNWAPAPFKHEVRMAKGDRAQAPPGIMMRGPATSVSGAPRAQLQPIRTSPAQRYTVPLRKISEEKDKDAATGGQENAGA